MNTETITNELLSRGDWHINATITFRYDVTEQQALKTAHLFLNKLDKHYFGNARRKGKRIKRLVAHHTDSTRHHFHILFETPKNIKPIDFVRRIRSTSHSIPSLGQTHIKPTESQANSINYNFRNINNFEAIGTNY